jgi:hypothetical protein
MAKLRAIARCSLPIECGAHGDDAAPSRRLRAISILITVIPSGGSTRSRSALGSGTWLTAPSASLTVASCGVASGQIELDPPAEELAGSDAIRQQTHTATPCFFFSCTIAPFARW